ncbi:RNA 2',3'-cyclic phosphodiesterase [Metabacillus litoralis]|uniref:RNA 2',3'-cyclic phosphodiesterase n=1 Tax=Metabacillus litoralis TaxID=152268 RepID=UPI001CFEA8E3|nr:RNA 2',3'-cyclic phosphodiesterase [Metabacillus litoralis]
MKKHHPHFFIAVPIEDHIGNNIKKWISTNKNELAFKSWVHPEDYHITLAFLGNVEDTNKLEKIKGVVREIVAMNSSFQLKVKGIDIFGKKDSPRILWVSLEESKALVDLQQKVFKACLENGIKLDSKPFAPHITIARKWNSEEPFHYSNDYIHVFSEVENEFNIKQIHFYETHLDRIPKYEAIDIFPLYSDALQGEK